jgi:hypothetical protein
MDVNKRFRILRVKLRKNSKAIMNDVLKRHVPILSLKDKPKTEICVFCASKDNLTKEHILPKWTFENCTKKYFVTDVNGSEQTYNKTTIPVCNDCNNNILGGVEKYIISIIDQVDLSESFFTVEQLHNIIRWLEIIEYKFQIVEIRRKYFKHKSNQSIKLLRDIPISVMRPSIDFSPNKAVIQIRLSQRRVTVKSKFENHNSLVVFKTKNKSFHFFHQMNEFIFIELPRFGIAFFYFFTLKFENEETAKKEAMKLIKKVY